MVRHVRVRTLQVQIPELIPLLLLQDTIVAACTPERQLKQEEIQIGKNKFTNPQCIHCGSNKSESELSQFFKKDIKNKRR